MKDTILLGAINFDASSQQGNLPDTGKVYEATKGDYKPDLTYSIDVKEEDEKEEQNGYVNSLKMSDALIWAGIAIAGIFIYRKFIK